MIATNHYMPEGSLAELCWEDRTGGNRDCGEKVVDENGNLVERGNVVMPGGRG
jgi:hypothetical protein